MAKYLSVLLLLILSSALDLQALSKDEVFSNIATNIVQLEKLQTSISNNTADNPTLRNRLILQVLEKVKLVDKTLILLFNFQKEIPSSDILLDKKILMIQELANDLNKIKENVNAQSIQEFSNHFESLKNIFNQDTNIKPSRECKIPKRTLNVPPPCGQSWQKNN